MNKSIKLTLGLLLIAGPLAAQDVTLTTLQKVELAMVTWSPLLVGIAWLYLGFKWLFSERPEGSTLVRVIIGSVIVLGFRFIMSQYLPAS